MNFIELNDSFKPLEITKLLENGDIKTGTGGSNNFIIVDGEQVLKIIPKFKKYWNYKINFSNDQEEIKFYKFFTKHLLLTNKTPHIVGSYDTIKIDLKKLFNKYKGKCKEIINDGKPFKNTFETLMYKNIYENPYKKQEHNKSKKSKETVFRKILNFILMKQTRKNTKDKKDKKDKKDNKTKKANIIEPYSSKTEYKKKETNGNTKLTKNLENSICNFNIKKCGMVLHGNFYLSKYLDAIYLESCPKTISSVFSNEIISNDDTKDTKDTMESRIVEFITRVIFQYSFTMCAIYKILPSFIHNDMFLRNILAKTETTFGENDYVEYKCNDMTFYLPANGIYIKLNDFGYSLAYPKLGDKALYKNLELNNNCYDNTVDRNPPNMTIDNSHNNDTFNFLHDLYDASNFGDKSLLELARISKGKGIDKDENIKTIKSTIDKFIDTDVIDKIHKLGNKFKLSNIWNVNTIPELEATIKHPMNYLKNNFTLFTTKPAICNVVRTYEW